jgi:hypothetical protein
MLKSFYHYYQTDQDGPQISKHDLPDKMSTFAVGRYINSNGKAFYSK